MKSILILCAISLLVICLDEQDTGNPVSINFANSDWVFPSTVQQAVVKHTLDYKPPGYYYKTDKKGITVILDYHFISGDFGNEHQPKAILYPRDLHSYIFQFPENPGTYDSLKLAIEKQFNRSFVLTKGIKDSEYAVVKEFEFNLLKINPSLTVGIKRSKSEERKDLVTVRFMYGLPLGRMGVVMGNY